MLGFPRKYLEGDPVPPKLFLAPAKDGGAPPDARGSDGAAAPSAASPSTLAGGRRMSTGKGGQREGCLLEFWIVGSGSSLAEQLSLAAVDETEFCRSQPGCFGFSLQGNTTAKEALAVLTKLVWENMKTRCATSRQRLLSRLTNR